MSASSSSSSSSVLMMKIRQGFHDTSHHLRTFDYKRLLYDPYPFVALWIVGCIVAVKLPNHYWNQGKEEYYSNYGYQIEYDIAQRQYEQAQRNNNNNNDDNKNNYYYNSIQQYKNCKWYQLQCRKKHKEILDLYSKAQYYNNLYGNNNQNNNNRDDRNEYRVSVPDWYHFIGGTFEGDEADQAEEQIWGERERERDMEMYGNVETGVMEFIHVWVIIMFLGIVLHGTIVLLRIRPTHGVRLATFMFIQFLFLIILLIGQGVIHTDDRDLENNIYGFYGQLSILTLYTCVSFMVYCIIAHVGLQIRGCILAYIEQRRLKHEQLNSVPMDGTESNPYKIHVDH